jgi:pimeloyl-ACP methyl ester carboxylesterase
MDFPEARLVETNGINLAVHECGEGIPLVLCHGWPELGYSWRHQVPALVEAGYRVIIPDQRGYGDSDKPVDVEAYDIHHLAADHAGLLDALDIEKAVYIGHDWGAILVWNYALLYPQRVMGIANMAVPFRPREPSDPVAFWEKMLGPDFYIVHFNRQPGVAVAAFDKDPENFLRNMYRTNHWLGKPDNAAVDAVTTNIIDRAQSLSPPGELMMSEEELAVFTSAFAQGGFTGPVNWYRNFTRNWETTADVVQQISQPALMIYGAHDSIPVSRDMHEYVQDLEIHTLDCGHWIQQERPQETNAILLEWLQRKFQPTSV